MSTTELKKLLEKAKAITDEVEKYCEFNALSPDYVNNHTNRQIICKLLMEFYDHVTNIEEVFSATSGRGTTSLTELDNEDHIKFYDEYIKPNKNKFWVYPDPGHFLVIYLIILLKSQITFYMMNL